MPHFLILAPDRPDALDLRLANRQDHINYWHGLPGVVKVAGAMLEGDRLLGSTFLIEADDVAAAEALIAGDPFTTAGVFTRDHSIIEVRPAIGDWLSA